MATVVEKLVAELKWDTNRTELAKARGDADKLKAASKQLEDEQRKSVKTTAKLREEMQDLRVAVKAGLITQADFKKKTSDARLALGDETLAAKRTTTALRELNAETRNAVRDATANARAQDRAAAATIKSAHATARAAAAEQAREGRFRQKLADTRSRVLGSTDSKLAAMRGRADARIAAANNRPQKSGFFRSPGSAAVAGGVVAGNMITGGARAAIDGIGDALVGSAAKAIAFESAMADVAKVVDGLKGPRS